MIGKSSSTTAAVKPGALCYNGGNRGENPGAKRNPLGFGRKRQPAATGAGAKTTRGGVRRTMRKRRVKIRRNVRVFRKLLLLLAGCLLVFLLCVRLGTRRMEAEIRQRDDRQAWDALQQVEHAGEMLIDELLGLSEDIVSQKNLVAFSTGEKGKESLVVELLREKMESSTLINNVYLLSPDQNICVTANGRENLAGITSMLTEEGQTVLLNPADFTGRFRFLSLAPGKNPDNSTLTFVRPVMDESATRVGMVLFLLDRNTVNIRNGAFMLPSRYDLYWLDGTGVLYNTNEVAAAGALRFSGLRESTAQLVEGEAGRGKLRCYSMKSPRTELAYAILTPDESYAGMAARVWLPVTVGALLILAAGGWFFFRYVRGQSRTISNAFQVLSEKGIVNMDDAETEGLDKLVVKLVAEREILSDRLDHFRSIDFDNKLALVLAGGEEPDESFRFLHGLFAVCVISIDNQSVFRKDKSINASEEKALIKLVVDNVLSEHYVCYSRFAGKKIACLINFRERGDKTGLQTILEELEVLRGVCEEELELIFVAGVSGVSENRGDIGALYEEAIRAQEYARVRSLPLVAYDEVEKKIRNPEAAGNYYKRLIEKEQLIIENCQPWNYRNVAAAVADFEKLLLSNPVNTFDEVQDKCKEAFLAMVNTLRQNRQAEVYDAQSERRDMEELRLCNTSEQLHVFFTLFLKKLDDCVTSSRVEEQDYFIAKVESILEKNYADMSLSVGMIAEELNMPMRLVSSQYKQKTGYGLLDRIHSFRVEKAKAMLLDTQDSVYEIAERCGYENVNTFIRVFRKYTGKTPGRFRGN